MSKTNKDRIERALSLVWNKDSELIAYVEPDAVYIQTSAVVLPKLIYYLAKEYSGGYNFEVMAQFNSSLTSTTNEELYGLTVASYVQGNKYSVLTRSYPLEPMYVRCSGYKTEYCTDDVLKEMDSINFAEDVEKLYRYSVERGVLLLLPSVNSKNGRSRKYLKYE